MADSGTRKTKPTSDDVAAYLAGVEQPGRRADAQDVLALMREVTGAEPVMWGASMVGFGTLRYTTADGKRHEWFAVGLAPRQAALTLYGLTYYGSNADLLERLGTHTTGKGCLYVKRLEDVDTDVLRELVARAWATNHADDLRPE
ncbi:DUF1801 domain-containing protein [Nocardioides sp.]|uniref:DUF1801 domain-containing protein n=1 Tax=Nocardioides sp. TaxID=35761 RepID=UPI002B2751EF|nr:DUF1801 domain-containing protein [Nocardioides sp.]